MPQPTIPQQETPMSLMSEFKEFAMRGNVVDLAVGVIIGAAFGKIVSTLVDNVIMPPIGYLIGGVDFSELVLKIGNPVADAKGVVTGGALIKYGVFLNTVIQFLIVAFVVFIMVKLLNTMMKKKEATPAAPPEPTAEAKLLVEIRDLLARRA
jgi:large conductance mechanosensitive channel